MWKFAAALSLAFLASGSVAVAQMKEKAPATPRSAASIECSKQADAKRPTRESAQEIPV